MATKLAEGADFATNLVKEGVSQLGNPSSDKKYIKQILLFGLVFLVVVLVVWVVLYFTVPEVKQTMQEIQDAIIAAHQATRARGTVLQTPASSAPSAPSKSEGFAVQPAPRPVPGWDSKLSLYGMLLKSMDPQERYLVNLCPLTASIGGFLGPLDKGVFEPNYFVRACLSAGIRSFVLPISTYMDDNKVPPEWPFSTKPAIVYRDQSGKILSQNGLSVRKFCEALVLYRSENTVQAEEPILLYLHAEEAFLPDKSTQEKAYVKLMSDLAEEMQPLSSFLLKAYSTMGSMVNARREREILLEVPLVDLKNKILTFTNFDFTLAQKKEYASMPARLGDVINFAYAPVVASNAGLGKGTGSRSLRLEDVSGSKIEWRNEARNLWHTTLLSSKSEMPAPSLVDQAIRTGIQAIPCPWVFKDDDPNALQIWSQWKGYAFRVKEPAARYAKPVPVAPQVPSARLNARVSNTLQPGQTQIR